MTLATPELATIIAVAVGKDNQLSSVAIGIDGYADGRNCQREDIICLLVGIVPIPSALDPALTTASAGSIFAMQSRQRRPAGPNKHPPNVIGFGELWETMVDRDGSCAILTGGDRP